MALALAFQVRHERLDAVHHTHQVDRDGPGPTVRRPGLHRTAGADAGVVADDVDLTEALDRFLRRREDSIAIADVEKNAVDICVRLAQLRDRGAKGLFFDIRKHEAHAGARETRGKAEADAAGAAGNEGDLVVEILHHAACLRSSASNEASSARLFANLANRFSMFSRA